MIYILLGLPSPAHSVRKVRRASLAGVYKYIYIYTYIYIYIYIYIHVQMHACAYMRLTSVQNMYMYMRIRMHFLGPGEARFFSRRRRQQQCCARPSGDPSATWRGSFPPPAGFSPPGKLELEVGALREIQIELRVASFECKPCRCQVSTFARYCAKRFSHISMVILRRERPEPAPLRVPCVLIMRLLEVGAARSK